MAIYGMKDAANLIMVSKKTKLPALYVDYANATTSEWTSESVYATRKGANAIRWDGSRNGTLTLETELFDFGMLAMIMGSDVKEGRSDVFTRVEGTLDKTLKLKIGEDISIDSDTISVIKLKSDLVEHDGQPLWNDTVAKRNLPDKIDHQNFTISANSDTAKINFRGIPSAESYKIVRKDGTAAKETIVYTGTGTDYVDTGLTASTDYTYHVVAVNEFGTGPKSAQIKVTTSATGAALTQFVPLKPEIDAANASTNVGAVNSPGAGTVTYTYNDGEITFSADAIAGYSYAVYFMEHTENVRTLTIEADKFADSYEIFANSTIRRQEDGVDELVQIHYFNAKPQSNFTLTQSATEPTSLSIVFDIMPERGKLAEFKAIG